MPNIFTCDPQWVEKLKKGEDKVIVAVWCGSDEKCNRWLEKLAQMEEPGKPVFVIDMDSCPQVAESLGVKAGETIVFNKGEEKGRVALSDDIEGDIAKVKEYSK